MSKNKTPHIVALITDLFFAMRVRNSAEQLGSSLQLIDTDSEFSDPKRFTEFLASQKPKIIILDLNASLPWREWLPLAKSQENSAAIPWLAFGSHKDAALLKQAKQLGVDQVMPRSKFTKQLPELIKSFSDD